MATRKCVRKLQAHEGYVRGIAFTQDGSKFLTIGDDKTIKTWNTDISPLQTADENVNTILSKVWHFNFLTETLWMCSLE